MTSVDFVYKGPRRYGDVEMSTMRKCQVEFQCTRKFIRGNEGPTPPQGGRSENGRGGTVGPITSTMLYLSVKTEQRKKGSHT